MRVPEPVDHAEKHSYLNHNRELLIFFSLLSFIGITWSSARFFATNPLLYWFYPFLVFSIVYYLVSLYVQGFAKQFDFEKHLRLIEEWKPNRHPTVDVFLPVCGEPASIIRNSWQGIDAMRKAYPGHAEVYCLDDGDNLEIKVLAAEFGFKYLVRDNRGHFKKAGNLNHGYKNSFHEIIERISKIIPKQYHHACQLNKCEKVA